MRRAPGALALAAALAALLADDPCRIRLGENAARDARERFDVERQVDAHLALYEDVVRPRSDG